MVLVANVFEFVSAKAIEEKNEARNKKNNKFTINLFLPFKLNHPFGFVKQIFHFRLIVILAPFQATRVIISYQ